jgi:hypothetical protein
VRRLVPLVVCAVLLSAFSARGQSGNLPSFPHISPLQIPAGTIVNFQLQTRMKAAAADVLGMLPKGTMLHVKLLDAIDSTALRDGSVFRGLIVSSVDRDDRVVIHADAEVRGLFALLRSASHPDGFQYQLLVTGLVDRGHSYTLTAFLDSDPAISVGNSVDQQDSLQPTQN